jgi:D-cysteine desulfhydrase
MSDNLSRRSFLKKSAAATVGMAVACSPAGGARETAPRYRPVPLDDRLLPSCEVEAGTSAALVRRFPWVRFGEKPGGRLQIATLPGGLEYVRTSGAAGERIFELASGARLIPWAPMFRRPTLVYPAPGALRPAGAGRVFIKDEGSAATLLYGNKIRKYEFLLPNLASSGVSTLRTHGAYGSNHVAYLNLAARYGHYRPEAASGALDLELMLYPQELSGNVLAKLRLLVASGARLRFLEGDAAVGLSIFSEELRSRSSAVGTTAYVPPGGSSPLSVLGHVEALLELAEQIESGDCELATPPDYIFVPLGSGATAMGLVLGSYLLGWPTTVVGTCSQDKSRWARLVVNGDADTPFLVANAASLLEKSLKWVEAMGLSPAVSLPGSHELLRRHFVPDSETWLPTYGQLTPEIARETAAAGEAGLQLDPTFTAKSLHTLKNFAAAGRLRNKSALFWNTYQRYPLERLLPHDDNWLSALPQTVRGPIAAFIQGNDRKTT